MSDFEKIKEAMVNAGEALVNSSHAYLAHDLAAAVVLLEEMEDALYDYRHED